MNWQANGNIRIPYICLDNYIIGNRMRVHEPAFVNEL